MTYGKILVQTSYSRNLVRYKSIEGVVCQVWVTLSVFAIAGVPRTLLGKVTT